MLTDMSIVGFRYHSLAFPPNISDVSLIVTKDSVDRLFVKVYLHFQICRYFENESDLSLNYLFISRCIIRRSPCLVSQIREGKHGSLHASNQIQN